jgi:hypothetical protein
MFQNCSSPFLAWANNTPIIKLGYLFIYFMGALTTLFFVWVFGGGEELILIGPLSIYLGTLGTPQ